MNTINGISIPEHDVFHIGHFNHINDINFGLIPESFISEESLQLAVKSKNYWRIEIARNGRCLECFRSHDLTALMEFVKEKFSG